MGASSRGRNLLLPGLVLLLGPGCPARCDDADLVQVYVDEDEDGYGTDLAAPACVVRRRFASRRGDCDDTNPEVHPDRAEDCGTPIDDDCDRLTNANPTSYYTAIGCTELHADEDADGYGSIRARCLCWPEEGYTAPLVGDCDDSDPTVYAGSDACQGIETITVGRVDGRSGWTSLGDFALTVGDFVGDEAQDLIVGTIRPLGSDGVLYAVPGGIGTTSVAASDVAAWSGSSNGPVESIGRWAGVLDANADGRDDLAFTGPWWYEPGWPVHLLLGPMDEDGGEIASAISATWYSPGGGGAIAVIADSDGQGSPTILVQSYSEYGTDHVYVISDFPPGTHSLPDSSTHLEGSPQMDVDGVADGGDLDGDGLADIVVTASEYGAGAIYVVSGPLSGAMDLRDADGALLDGKAESLASGADADGDGTQDLLIGWSNARGWGGEAYLVLGPIRGETELTDAAAATLQATAADGGLGSAVAFVDSGAEVALVATAPGASIGGSGVGLVGAWDGASKGTLGVGDGAAWYGAVAGDWMGPTAAITPDLDGDGVDDLWVGMPGSSVSGSYQVGSVLLLSGAELLPSGW